MKLSENISMKNSKKMILAALISAAAIALATMIGSVNMSLSDFFHILLHQICGTELPAHITDNSVSIIWRIRLPRVIMCYLVGAALASGGVVMQSVLRNPLASSYTLGVSSGASLGAAFVILLNVSLPFASIYSLPLAGFVFGLGTVFLAMGLAARFDRNMENNTIILVGMVLSLFVNALLTLMIGLAPDRMKELSFWQMGSFSAMRWSNVQAVFPVVLIGLIILLRFTREMDLMTFGEEEALSAGVELKKMKFLMIGVSALLTGVSVAFAGTIGFVDLIAPHVVRRIFGPRHKLVLPASAMFGGTFLVLADLISRTVLAPREIPVGAVTALIGAPFFAYIYFKRKPG